MSQSVKIAGALFQNVPSISVPDENNVYHGFFDVSDTTATASDVASGKFFHDALGVLTAGTASGGGGGLVYETGTYTPSSDIARPTINFANSHTEPPILVMLADATGTDHTASYSNYACIIANINGFIGGGVPSTVSSNRRYGVASYVYRSSGNPAQGTSAITNPTSSSSVSDLQYWVTNTGFIPSSASTSRYWRAGRTYKWIAVWAPT